MNISKFSTLWEAWLKSDLLVFITMSNISSYISTCAPSRTTPKKVFANSEILHTDIWPQVFNIDEIQIDFQSEVRANHNLILKLMFSIAVDLFNFVCKFSTSLVIIYSVTPSSTSYKLRWGALYHRETLIPMFSESLMLSRHFNNSVFWRWST